MIAKKHFSVAIAGLKKAGIAMNDLAKKNGFSTYLIDDNLENDTNITSTKKANLENIDLLVLSPGFKANNQLEIEAKEKFNLTAISDIEFAYKYRINKTAKWILITGTNGKTTVTKMVTKILNDFGINSVAAGNIGYPICTAVQDKKAQVFVVECSSFQLYRTHQKIKAKVAAVLNLSEDHIDWHGSYKDYKNSKLKILKMGAENNFDFSKIQDSDSAQNLNEFFATKIAGCFGVSLEKIDKSLKTFKQDKHRFALIAKDNKISYYNDSKATNIQAALNAVNSISKESKIILITGGLAKGVDFEKNDSFQKILQRISGAVVLGENQDNNIIEALKKSKTTYKIAHGSNAKSIIQDAIKKSNSIFKDLLLDDSTKKAVVLAPATASMDLFNSYSHRGDIFEQEVKNYLIKKGVK